MNSFLLFRENVRNTRNFQMLSNSTKKAVRYGLETVSHRPPFVWANLLQDYKSQTYFMPLNKKKKMECRSLSVSALHASRGNLGLFKRY